MPNFATSPKKPSTPRASIEVASLFDAISDDSDAEPTTPTVLKLDFEEPTTPSDPRDRLRRVTDGSSYKQDANLAREKLERQIERLRCAL